MDKKRYDEIMQTSDIEMRGDAPGSERPSLRNLLASAVSQLSLNGDYLKAAMQVEFDKLKMGARIYKAGWQEELESWSLASAAKVVAISAIMPLALSHANLEQYVAGIPQPVKIAGKVAQAQSDYVNRAMVVSYGQLEPTMCTKSAEEMTLADYVAAMNEEERIDDEIEQAVREALAEDILNGKDLDNLMGGKFVADALNEWSSAVDRRRDLHEVVQAGVDMSAFEADLSGEVRMGDAIAAYSERKEELEGPEPGHGQGSSLG